MARARDLGSGLRKLELEQRASSMPALRAAQKLMNGPGRAAATVWDFHFTCTACGRNNSCGDAPTIVCPDCGTGVRIQVIEGSRGYLLRLSPLEPQSRHHQAERSGALAP